MNPFEYHAATSVAEATALLDRYGDDALAMAGATALVPLLKQGLVRPAHVVGLAGIAELRGVAREAGGTLRIGALVTHREAERSPEVRAHAAALAAMFSRIATIRVRNQATVGGNLAHADPAQDPPPMLLALDAAAEVAGPAGRRTIALADLFVDYFQTALAPNEVLVAVRVPPLARGSRATYVKFLPRSADDYATVSVAAVALRAADGTVADARVALGSAGPTPIRARRAEDALRGARPDPARLREAAALVRDEVDPIADARGSAAYKREMARVWTERALRAVLEA